MKYLKRINESISLNELNEIVKTIEEICLEAKDDGFNVSIKTPGDTRVKTIDINITNAKKGLALRFK
jgi:hypothetical protein